MHNDPFGMSQLTTENIGDIENILQKVRNDLKKLFGKAETSFYEMFLASNLNNDPMEATKALIPSARKEAIGAIKEILDGTTVSDNAKQVLLGDYEKQLRLLGEKTAENIDKLGRTPEKILESTTKGFLRKLIANTLTERLGVRETNELAKVTIKREKLKANVIEQLMSQLPSELLKSSSVMFKNERFRAVLAAKIDHYITPLVKSFDNQDTENLQLPVPYDLIIITDVIKKMEEKNAGTPLPPKMVSKMVDAMKPLEQLDASYLEKNKDKLVNDVLENIKKQRNFFSKMLSFSYLDKAIEATVNVHKQKTREEISLSGNVPIQPENLEFMQDEELFILTQRLLQQEAGKTNLRTNTVLAALYQACAKRFDYTIIDAKTLQCGLNSGKMNLLNSEIYKGYAKEKQSNPKGLSDTVENITANVIFFTLYAGAKVKEMEKEIINGNLSQEEKLKLALDMTKMPKVPDSALKQQIIASAIEGWREKYINQDKIDTALDQSDEGMLTRLFKEVPDFETEDNIRKTFYEAVDNNTLEIWYQNRVRLLEIPENRDKIFGNSATYKALSEKYGEITVQQKIIESYLYTCGEMLAMGDEKSKKKFIEATQKMGAQSLDQTDPLMQFKSYMETHNYPLIASKLSSLVYCYSKKPSKELRKDLKGRTPEQQLNTAIEMWNKTINSTPVTHDHIKHIYPTLTTQELKAKAEIEQRKQSFTQSLFLVLGSSFETSNNTKTKMPLNLITGGRTQINLNTPAELSKLLDFLGVKPPELGYYRTSTHEFTKEGKEIKTLWGGLIGAVKLFLGLSPTLETVLKKGGMCQIGVDLALGGVGQPGLDGLPITSNGRNGTALLVINVDPKTKEVQVLMGLEDSAPFIKPEKDSIIDQKAQKKSGTGDVHSLVGATSGISPVGCTDIEYGNKENPWGKFLQKLGVTIPKSKYNSYKIDMNIPGALDTSIVQWKQKKEEGNFNLKQTFSPEPTKKILPELSEKIQARREQQKNLDMQKLGIVSEKKTPPPPLPPRPKKQKETLSQRTEIEGQLKKIQIDLDAQLGRLGRSLVTIEKITPGGIANSNLAAVSEARLSVEKVIMGEVIVSSHKRIAGILKVPQDGIPQEIKVTLEKMKDNTMNRISIAMETPENRWNVARAAQLTSLLCRVLMTSSGGDVFAEDTLARETVIREMQGNIPQNILTLAVKDNTVFERLVALYNPLFTSLCEGKSRNISPNKMTGVAIDNIILSLPTEKAVLSHLIIEGVIDKLNKQEKKSGGMDAKGKEKIKKELSTILKKESADLFAQYDNLVQKLFEKVSKKTPSLIDSVKNLVQKTTEITVKSKGTSTPPLPFRGSQTAPTVSPPISQKVSHKKLT